MADEKEIIYRIKIVEDDAGKLTELTAQLAQANKEKAELNKKIKSGADLTKEEKDRLLQLTTESKAYSNELKKINSELDRKVKTQAADINSLAGMRAKVAELRAEYEKLDPATKKSQALGKSIADLQGKINQADFATKNFRGNVGNYQGAIEAALGKTGLLNSEMGGLVTTLGAGIPVVAGVGAAVGVMAQYFASSENRADALQVSMSVLKGGMDDARASINETIDAIGGGEGGLAGVITSATRAIETQIGAWDALGKSYIREYLAQYADRLGDNARAQEADNAAISKKIAMLKLMAADQNISDERKASYLRQAQEAEDKVFKQRMAQAIQEFDLLKGKYAIEEKTQELNDAYYSAKARLEKLQEEAYQRQIELESKASGLEEKSLKVEEAKTKEIKKQIDLKGLDGQDEAAPVLRMPSKMRKEDTELKQYEEDIARMQELNDERAANEIKNIEDVIKYEQWAREQTFQIQQAKVQVASDALGTLASMLDEQSNEFKLLASAQAVIDTYGAANAAYKSASEIPVVGWVLGPIAAATAVAAGLANVAKINGVKFADGGLLQGASHEQGGIMIEAEGGEAIINKRSTSMYRPLLSEINKRGGGVGFAERGMLVPSSPDFAALGGGAQLDKIGMQMDSMFNKITSIPVTVLADDITRTQRKVAVIDKQGNI